MKESTLRAGKRGSNDKTAEAQAENRRVVVRILQNKAIAGT